MHVVKSHSVEAESDCLTLRHDRKVQSVHGTEYGEAHWKEREQAVSCGARGLWWATGQGTGAEGNQVSHQDQAWEVRECGNEMQERSMSLQWRDTLRQKS